MKRLLESKAFFAGYMLVSTLLLAELGARAYFSLEIGPRVLAYGTAWYRNNVPDPVERRRRKATGDEKYVREFEKHVQAETRADSVEQHENKLAGYSKFFPNEAKSTRDVETGERIATKINENGYRGDSFSTEKPAGVVRILTLGSSSTFGYYDRDDETYPVYLEEILNERCGGSPAFEVINFGIPHMGSSQIAQMFLEEGVALRPDVVTFYEGRNDSVAQVSPDGPMAKLHAVLRNRSILVAFVDQAFVGDRESIDGGALKFDVDAATHSAHFLANIERIRLAAQADGIHLLIANQQATAAAPFPRPAIERMGLRGVTYQQEADAIRERMNRAEEIGAFEYALLIHQRMMLDLETWAQQNSLEFVDLIGAMNHERDHLLSWVHLAPAGNRIIATALADKLAPRFCPTVVGRAP